MSRSGNPRGRKGGRVTPKGTQPAQKPALRPPALFVRRSVPMDLAALQALDEALDRRLAELAS